MLKSCNIASKDICGSLYNFQYKFIAITLFVILINMIYNMNYNIVKYIAGKVNIRFIILV